MGKWLSGGAETGSKIMNNWSSFSYDIDSAQTDRNEGRYFFNWHFDNQYGYISIKVKDNKVNSSSQIYTKQGSEHPFSKPLGLYNDSSLFDIFEIMLRDSYNINVSGVFTD